MRKKTLLSIVLIVLLMLSPIAVWAEGEYVDISLSCGEYISQNEDFTLNITLTCSGFTSKEAKAEISLPAEFEIVGVSGANLSGKTLTWNTSEDVSSFSAAISVRCSSSFTSEKTISVKGSCLSEGNVSISSQSASANISMVSSDNTLSELKINGNSVNAFSPTKTTYTLSDTKEASITIDAKANDNNATVSGLGSVDLTYGTNNIKVTVTAENGVQRTYFLIIKRIDERNSDNTLKSLTTDKGDFIFSSVRTSYNVYVNYDVTKIEVKAQVNNEKAKIVSGVGKHDLVVGSNTIEVIVEAENEAQKTYTIFVTRKNLDGQSVELSKNNLLSSLEVSYDMPVGEVLARQKIDIGFDGNKLEYTFFVPNEVNKIYISAKAANINSKVEVENVEKLQVGKNIIKVRTENGSTNEYILNVIKYDNTLHVNIKDVLSVLGNTTEKIITLDLSDTDSQVLDYEIFALLNEFDKTLVVNKYEKGEKIYSWEFIGGYLPFDKAFDSVLDFTEPTDEKYIKAKDETSGIDLDFAYRGNLCEGVSVSIYAGDKYSDNSILNIYKYDSTKNKMELVTDKASVKDGYVKYSFPTGDMYYITDEKISEVDWFIVGIIAGSSAFIVMLFCVIALIKKKRSQYKHNSENDLENYDEYADTISPEIKDDDIDVSEEPPNDLASDEKDTLDIGSTAKIEDNINKKAEKNKESDEEIEQQAKEINDLLESLDMLFGEEKK